ncbi:MAG: Crp/Fnr family transcriptional regulator [Chitinophagaceae bacterium]|nr:Crp/Fnr family transcriptional regulator [Chitinophagaceae bacterium]
MEELFLMLSAIRPMGEELVNYLRSILVAVELRKNQFLLKKGQVCNYIYFVKTGILRSFYTDENGKETTKWFMDEGNVITSVDSFFSRTPTLEPIHALEPSLLYGISHQQLFYAFENMDFSRHGIEILIRYHVLNERRISALQRLSAAEKYLYTKQTQPNIVEKVPDKYLATYLGITKETLSRIKN